MEYAESSTCRCMSEPMYRAPDLQSAGVEVWTGVKALDAQVEGPWSTKEAYCALMSTTWHYKYTRCPALGQR